MLVLGASGMLGHKLAQIAVAEGFEVIGTIRGGDAGRLRPVIPAEAKILTGVGLDAPGSFRGALTAARPDLVVNCIGAVKQLATGRDPVEAIRINSLFPHQLAALCSECEARLIQISTDCVFSGERGGYREEDAPDASDVYGRSKLLGEVTEPPALTLRTSFIGRELAGSSGLVEWLISERGGTVRGFGHAIFSGLSSIELARAICAAGAEQRLTGLYHLGADPIDKHSLLVALRDALGLDVEIDRDESVRIDRSLDSSRLRAEIDWLPPGWPEMIAVLAGDPTPYPSLGARAQSETS